MGWHSGSHSKLATLRTDSAGAKVTTATTTLDAAAISWEFVRRRKVKEELHHSPLHLQMLEQEQQMAL